MLGVWSVTREKSRRKEEMSATYKHLPTIEAIFEKTEGLHLKKKKKETKLATRNLTAQEEKVYLSRL